jgi:ankyrin repeat protein
VPAPSAPLGTTKDNLMEQPSSEPKIEQNAGAPQLRKMPVTSDTYLFAALRTANAEELESALKRGANPNAKTAQGTPALVLAVQSKDASLVRRLLQAKADAKALDAQGLTPLAHAKALGLEDIARLLEVAGGR